MLSSIPDRELSARLEALRRDERASCTDILQHLIEVERRNLHLRLGFSSLFSYCTGHLRYAEADAARRVQAARCLRRFPAVGPLLHGGEITLATLGLVAGLLTEENLGPWLERIRGKTQREVEAIAATVRPPMTLRDRARLVLVPVPAPAPLPLEPATDAPRDPSTPRDPLFAPPPDASSPDETSPAADTAATAPGRTTTPPRTPVSTRTGVYIQFLVGRPFMARYRMAVELLSNKLPRLTFEAVFAALIDDFLRRHQPAERHLRRERAAEARVDEPSPRSSIPRGIRDAVFARDQGRCTYVGSNGKRCNETLRLHVDHIRPVAKGGSDDLSNLRLLCARHNRLMAEKLLGRATMKRFEKGNGERVTRPEEGG